MEYRYLFSKEDDNIVDYLKNTINIKLSCHTPYFDYDFNNGLRIKFFDTNSKYRLILTDKKTKNILYEQNIQVENDVIYTFPKKYYIEYEATILQVIDEGLYNSIPIYTFYYDCADKEVLFLLANEEPPGLGDCIAWISAIHKFHIKNPSTKIYICTEYEDLNNLIKEKYSCFNFISHKEILKKTFYATYLLGCFFNDPLRLWCPNDYRTMSLHEIGYSILGLDCKEHKINLQLKNDNQSKPYVCIATHASGIYKEWLYQSGWEKIVNYLTNLGYDVYVIDAEKYNKQGNIATTSIPKNAIDKTGRISLTERAKLISGADFFIGLSSGLSWLAWACDVPVVLISGFTNPVTEFYTPYRVINQYVCNSCWNDPAISWDMDNTVCPRKTNPFSFEYLECSAKIGIYSVIEAINNIPIVQERIKNVSSK